MLEIRNLHTRIAEDGTKIIRGLNLKVKTGDVIQELPMEFAVEAQKLIGISLEGSVG